MLPSELYDKADKSQSMPVVAVDTETSAKHPDDPGFISTVSVAWFKPGEGEVESHAWPFWQGTLSKQNVRPKRKRDKIGGQGTLDLMFDEYNLPAEEYAWLIDWLLDQWLVFHNAPFDIAFLRAGIPGKRGQDLSQQVKWDTMLAERQFEGIASIGLDATAQRYEVPGKVGMDELEAWLVKAKLPPKRYDLAPWRVIEPYAVRDAEATLRVYAKQVRRQFLSPDPQIATRIQRELQVQQCILDMERNGMPYDATESLQIAKRLDTEATALERTLPFKPTLPQAKTYFFDLQGIEVTNRTEKGNPQLTDDVVERMVQDAVPHAAVWLRYTKLQKANSMWYRGYADKTGHDGRLRTILNQNSVISGRFSSGRANLQAIVHDYRLDGLPSVRGLFERAVPDGYVVYEIDLSQAEVRVGALMAGCQSILDIINAGGDVHGETAKDIFMTDPDHPDWTAHRQLAKRCNFSLQYGVGVLTFAEVLRAEGHAMSNREVAKLVYAWRDLRPEFGRMIKKVEAVVARRSRQGVGYLELPGGARRWFRPGEDLHKAYNQLVQGTISEITKRWMVATRERHGPILLMTTHDSLTVELLRDTAASIVADVVDLGVQAAEELLQGRVKMEAEAKPWQAKKQENLYRDETRMH